MRSILAALTRPLLACALLLVLVPAASAATAPHQPSGLLFVVDADGGTVVRHGATATVTLTGLPARIRWFDDRPTRRSGTMRVATLVSSWAAYGFAADPPNAVLQRGAGAAAPTTSVELERPRFDAATGTLTFRVRADEGSSLAGLPRRLGRVSLFIDDAGNLLYQPVSFQVSNAAPGQRIAIRLAPNGSNIGFSTGPAFQNSAGIQIVPQFGSIPVGQLNLSSAQLVVVTSSDGFGGGGALTFVIEAYLVADPSTSTFFLRSDSDPGVEITAQIGNAQPQFVNETQTLFAWRGF